MVQKRCALRMLTAPGVALSVLVLTMAMLSFVQAQDPSIVIVKEADQPVVSGSPVTFTIAINNTGDVTLTGVIVSDALVPDCNRPAGSLPDLIPGGSTGYTCVRANATADFTNSATVSGTDTLSDTVVSSSDEAFVDVISPGIDIVKTADPTVASVGDTISYTITVDNTGDSDLTGVDVDDDLAGCILSGPDGDDGDLVLEPSETWIYTCSVTAGSAGIVNTATVTATHEAGGTVTDLAQAEVDVIHPAIGIAKTPDMQTVASGSDVTFAIAVTNSGDATLTDVAVSDIQAPGCNANLGTLAAHASTSYQCTRTNVTDGFINSATVTGSPQAGQVVTDSDAAKVRLDETVPCPNDMIAYWKLDETSGFAYDDYYDGHDGECADDCPTPVSGHVNGGQAFNGSTTGIKVPAVPGDDSFDWGVSDSFSVEFWMQADAAGGCSGNNQVVVGRHDGSTSLHWWAGCQSDGKAAFYVRDKSGPSTPDRVAGTTDLTDAAWHHIVAVRDAGASRILIYVDGAPEDSTLAFFDEGFDSPTAGLSIGWINLSPGYYFDGAVDEVAVYDRALSASEIQQHYHEGLAGRWYCQSGTYPPVIVSDPVVEAVVGRPYVYDVEAAGDPVPTYTLSTYPNGMGIDTSTGLVSWTPIVAQIGTHPVEVEASNSEGIDTQSFAVEVSAGTICPTDMLAYWKLDETGGTIYSDFYDGHDGACAGTCPGSTTGRIGGGQEFDGSSTGIDALPDDDFDWGVNDSFSIEFWMQTASGSTCAENEVVIGRADTAAWWVGCQDGGEAAFYLRDTLAESALAVGGTVTGGAWHHVVATRDASTDEIRVYVDGVGGTPVGIGYTAGFGAPAAELNIGWLDTPSRFRFAGVIDEMAIYDRVLSLAEIQHHYNSGGSGPGYCINPDISIEKTANPEVVYSGNPVTYTYTVTNSGDVPLSSVGVSDDKCAPVVVVEGDEELAPDEHWVFRCLTTLDEDTTNTATVTGTHSFPDGTVAHTDAVFVDVIDPGIALDKVANPTSIDAGDTVTYTYVVTNPGDDPLSNVSVSDDKCAPVLPAGGDGNGNFALDPGEIWIYTCSIALSDDTTNVATATGTDSAGGTQIIMDTAFVDVTESTHIYLPLILKQHSLVP